MRKSKDTQKEMNIAAAMTHTRNEHSLFVVAMARSENTIKKKLCTHYTWRARTNTNATLHWKTQYQRYRIRTRNRVTTETKSKSNGFRFSFCFFWRLVLLVCGRSPKAITSMQCAIRLYFINLIQSLLR